MTADDLHEVHPVARLSRRIGRICQPVTCLVDGILADITHRKRLHIRKMREQQVGPGRCCRTIALFFRHLHKEMRGSFTVEGISPRFVVGGTLPVVEVDEVKLFEQLPASRTLRCGFLILVLWEFLERHPPPILGERHTEGRGRPDGIAATNGIAYLFQHQRSVTLHRMHGISHPLAVGRDRHALRSDGTPAGRILPRHGLRHGLFLCRGRGHEKDQHRKQDVTQLDHGGFFR